MDSHPTRDLLDYLFSTDEMRAVFSDRRRVGAMLTFEAALARACARAGAIPSEAADVIARHCDSSEIDLATLGRDGAGAGNLAIPLIQQLTELVARDDEAAANWIHWGATSQDVIDTGLVIQMRDGLALIAGGLARIENCYMRLAASHANTIQAGRTWMLQAAPITFGLKVAGWLSAVKRAKARLAELQPRALTLQFGGAVGTLAALGDRAFEVTRELGAELSLPTPDMPWHTQRDRMAEVGAALGLLTGTLGKIARDVSLLAQSEVAEVTEPLASGRGTSSTMPQKRNPVGSAVALAAAQRVPGLVATLLVAMPQENERGLGGWQAEWDVIPEIFLLTAGALQSMLEVADGLTVNASRMQANLDASHGLLYAEAVSFALAPKVGRKRAHELVSEAATRAVAHRRGLRETLADDPAITPLLTPADLERLFDSSRATGLASEFIKRALEG